MIIKGVNQNAIVQKVVDEWNRHKGARLQKEQTWRECWQAYQSQFGQTWYELANWRSKRYLPLTFQAVESSASQYTQLVMPDDDFFRTIGRTPEDDTRGIYNEALMRYQFYKTNFHNRFYQLVKQAEIFGNVPFMVAWRSRTTPIPDYEAFQADYAQSQANPSQPGPKKKLSVPTKEVSVYDGPELVVGNIFDFVIDRFPDDPTMAFRIMRTFQKKEALEQMNKNAVGIKLYENIDKVNNVSHYQEVSDAIRQQVDAQLGLQPSQEEGVDLLQAEGDFYLPDGSFYKNHIAVVGNKNTLLRFEPCPYLHGKPSWQLFKFYDDPNEAYGKGLVETVLPLQDIANVRVNQMIEANTLTLNPMLKYKEDGIIQPEALLTMPGALIATADTNNLQMLQFEAKGEEALRELGFIMAQFNQTTGADQSFTTENYKKSATEVANQAQAASARDQFMVRHIEQDAMIPVLSMWLRLNQQMMDRDTWVRIIGDSKTGMTFDDITGAASPLQTDALMVTPDDIAGDFDVIVVGSSMGAKRAQEIQNTIQLFQIIMQSQAASAVKLPFLLQDLARLMGLRESWRWLKTPQEMIVEQQQQMAQQLALRQASPGGGAGPGGGQGGPNPAGGQPGPVGLPSVPGQPSPGGMSAPGAPPMGG